MPSSAQTACYTGPNSVFPQSSSPKPTSMRPYYYKTGTNQPNNHPNPTPRARLVLHDANNHSPSSNRFANNSPMTPRVDDSRLTSARNSQQHNGQADVMSFSVHSPNVHYWPNSSQAPAVSAVSPYAQSTVPTTIPPTFIQNNTLYCGIDAANVGQKTNGKAPVSGKTASRPLWKERPHVGRYSLIRTIGKGNFAKVKLAQHLTTGMQVAVKVIDKTLLNHSSMQKLFREVRVLKTLNHPNIIKLLEVIESERHLYLVMEYASGGEVFDYLVTHGKMKESVARVKFRQIVSAVQYCHQKMVVHRDLKAENLLLDEELNVKIADFGFSNYFCPSQKLDTFCGSPPYAAPELFLGRKYDGPEVDVWSLGVILYTLVSGTLPFDGKNLKELRERVLRGTYRVPFYMTHECEMLLRKMLVLNPAKRLPLAEVMRDPWLNTGFESIMRPFSEPPADYCDPARIEIMLRLGFQRHEIQEALTQQRFNNITATYILLSRYDPQVHGRLPGLAHSSSERRASIRHKPVDFTLNGTTTPVVSSSLEVTSRPSGGKLNYEEDSTSKHGSASARNSTTSAPPSAASTLSTTSGSVDSTSATSTVKGSDSPGEVRLFSNPGTNIQRPQGLRRSATAVEPKLSSGITAKYSPLETPSSTPKPTTLSTLHDPSTSQAESPNKHRHPSATPSVTTTARLTLTNGSTQPSPGARLTPRPSSRSASVTAPLARVEDTTGNTMNGTPTRRSSTSSSSSSSSRSRSSSSGSSDVYDRERGSGSSEPPGAALTSVSIAAAPLAASLATPQVLDTSSAATQESKTVQPQEPRYTRLPSVQRKWSNRASAEPIVQSTAREARISNEASVNKDATRESNGESPKPAGARGLLRGPPNVADILNETNPFRLTNDSANFTPPATTVATTTTTGATYTPSPAILASSTATSTRTFSPPPSITGHVATRRPVAPPPLATATLSGFPSRSSYAYYSLRLPSATTTSAIASGKQAYNTQETSTKQQGACAITEDDDDDGMATPTQRSISEANKDSYSIPFSRNLPERSTIQHVPTGRARERLEGPTRLVRHPGTQSIANQSMRLRPHSPPYVNDTRESATPRPASPDELSISSANSSATTHRKLLDDYPSLGNYPPRSCVATTRHSNTLGSPVQSGIQQVKMRPLNSNNKESGGINNFFRSITTRISRSKLFRRSAIIQPPEQSSQPIDLNREQPRASLMAAELDRMLINPSLDHTSRSNRVQRSRSGVAPHRPVSQVNPRTTSTTTTTTDQSFRRACSRRDSREPSLDPVADSKSTLGRRWSKRSVSSQENRSSRLSTPSRESDVPHEDDLDTATLDRGSKSRRSMRYVLKPFAKWPLEEVMVEVRRALTINNVDFDVVEERKFHCVYGDPTVKGGIVHWDMEIGKLPGVGMNGIRFKRIDGSMATFKQIAKKLAADLRF